ncbi:MAG: AIR synthase family protein [Clostridiales Family XIII bacterium]|jgi:hydrogenase expression/formation protein HypE|nr:AIR synthase family protein [Clostridiales Family XIII bacterium]
MRIGKLDNDLLERIVIDKITFRRPEVKTRPGVGEDCAVIDFGAYDCVLSTDPITATKERIGSLAVNVSCNDIASNGVEPLGILLSVLLPPDTTEEEIADIMEQAARAAEKIGVEIIGGHTEVTDVVLRPVITATAVGRTKNEPSPLWTVRAGDRLIVTKTLALEGTGIIAAEYAERLATVLTPGELAEACAMLDSISVVTDGVVAAKAGVSGMHDITEGGLLGAAWELCELNGVGAALHSEALPVPEVTRKVCAHFGIDPLRLISSGSMLIAAPEETAGAVLASLAEAGIPATEIGAVTDRATGVRLDGAEIAPPESDEIYRV